uniref:Uncharacterized protein n=1 Tax=Corynebacterium silvaticum TaxID=2320431 RepID=A0A7U5HMT4_9CORY
MFLSKKELPYWESQLQYPPTRRVYAENGQVKFVHSLGKNPELFNQGESVTASHTHALTAADIEKSSVDKN